MAPTRFSLALLLAASLLTIGCTTHAPTSPKARIHRDILFASPQSRDLRMDLYMPQTTRRDAPVVVWIFGGSWKFGSKRWHVNVRHLTDHGIAVASIQYRLSWMARYPAQLDDCRAAVQWLRTHGRRFGIDPQRIGISGESAGGHLAALVGTVEGTPAIRAVFAMYSPSDLVMMNRNFHWPGKPGSIEKLLGGPVEENLALASEASPVNHVSPSSPPFLLIHGARDKLVPLEQSEELQRRLARANVEARLIVVPEKGHWFGLDKEERAEVARFFKSHFGMPASTTNSGRRRESYLVLSRPSHASHPPRST